MNNIKLETQPKLETLFLSIDENTLNKLDEILELPEIDIDEKIIIRKYKVLFKEIGQNPSKETLAKEFPSLYFEDVKPIKAEQLNDYISLFIANRKNNKISMQLLNLASTIKETGLDENVITQLNNITKADTVSKDYKDISKEILKVYKDKDDSKGYKTGVPQIDELTGGIKTGTLTTILGWTGSFKTTWAVNIGHQAQIDKANIIYLSLEVPKEDLMFNLLSRHSYLDKFETSIPKDKLMNRKLDEASLNYLEQNVYPDYINLPGKLYIVDETDLENYSTYALETKFRELDKLANEETGKGIDIVFIDHAQLLKFTTNNSLIGKETSVINQYVSFFRKNAIDWIKSGRKVAMVMLSQSSREGWKDATRHEGQYKLTALAEANELERASSLVLSTYSNEQLISMNAAKVSVLKSRNSRATPEPIETFVDPEYYVFGEVKGSSSTNSMSFSDFNLGSVLSSDQQQVQELGSLIDLNSIDLDI